MQHFGFDSSMLEPIVHADSLSSKVYRVRDRGLIVKKPYSRDRWQRECYFLQHLAPHIPVPKLVDAEEGVAILMEEVPGDLLDGSNLDRDMAIQIGELLGRLHSIPINSFGDVALGEKSDGITLKFDRYFDECGDALPPDLLAMCQEYVDANLHQFDDVDGPCIVHRDFRPGNILAMDGKITALIDFESMKGSFAEEDFGQIELLTWKRWPKHREAFLEGYGKIRKLPRLDEKMGLVLLMKSLGAIGFTLTRGAHHHVFEKNITFLRQFFAK